MGFYRNNARWLFGGFLLTLFSGFGQTIFIGASGGELREAFGLSNGQWGNLYGLATLASAATLPFVGRVMDYCPGWQVAAVTIPLLALACVSMAFSQTILMLGISLFMLRLLGQGMMSHIALTETARWFAATRGKAVSLVVLGFQAQEAILPLTFTLLVATYGYQVGWLSGAAALLLIGLPAIVFLYRKTREPKGEAELNITEGKSWTRGEVLRDPLFYAMATGVLAPPFIGTTLFFHRDHLAELRGISDATMGSGIPVMAGLTVIFALITGRLVDRYSASRILPATMIPLALGSLAVSVFDGSTGVVIFFGLFGVSYGLSSTLFGSLWPEVYGTKYLGSIRSVTQSAMVFATALGPWITGALIDRGTSLPTQFGWMALYCAAVFVVLLFASRRLVARAKAEA
ncbi:MFS transporter [Parvularcula sp. ZS-1/3]|uniref:MFS transporter n=1 Tax=Parvularcula mediterranea TaxID=2732508 RepID=A0A7Y3RJC6_9PROT|nr:MFS transporter [Parvularcula mediterranea]NNU15149.1 MFS transporter [Parvularcula mediterranea]